MWRLYLGTSKANIAASETGDVEDTVVSIPIVGMLSIVGVSKTTWLMNTFPLDALLLDAFPLDTLPLKLPPRTRQKTRSTALMLVRVMTAL